MNKKQPKVSVVVPCYNVERYLPQCMDSIINQTLKDIEIICVNDGSTDSTLRILQKYAEKDKRIKIIDKANSGYGASMNKGFSEASGEYLGIVESDDWVEPDMFENLYNLAKSNDVDVVKSNFYFYWSKPKIINIKKDLFSKIEKGEIIFPQSNIEIFRMMPSIWSAIYKRDFIKNNNIKFLETAGASYQDTGFNFKVWAVASKVVFTDKAYLHYRQDNEQSSINNKGKAFVICSEFEEINNFLDKNSLKLKDFLQRVKYDCYLWNLKRIDSSFKADFFNVFFQEFQKAYRNKEINFSLFKKDCNNLKQLLFKPKYFKNKYLSDFYEELNIRLFSFLPIYTRLIINGRTVYKILGLSVFKIRKFQNGITTKYYLFNVPIVKSSKKKY